MSHRKLPLFDPAELRRYAAPGQCIESQPFGERGTIGIIGVDRWTGRKVALTSMHVIPGVTEYPSTSHPEEIKFESPCMNGAGSIIGTLVRGTMSGIDAAVIDIDGQVISNFLSGVGKIEFYRSAGPADKNRPVRMVGAVSSLQHGRIVAVGEPVPEWNLDSAVVVEMVADYGDSGAPLVDENKRLIGMLVGGTSTRQLFCPIELVFHRLACTLFRR